MPSERVQRQIDRLLDEANLEGDLEGALAIGGDIIAQGEAGGAQSTPRNTSATYTLRSLLYLGRGEEALHALAPQTPGAAERGERPAMRALCLAHLRRRDESRSTMHELVSRYGIGPKEDETPAAHLLWFLETAVLLNDRETLALLAERLADMSALAVHGSPALTCPARHLGAAAALLGDREKAKAYYQQALEVCAKVRFRPEIALTRLQLAELLLEESGNVGAGSPRPGRSS